MNEVKSSMNFNSKKNQILIYLALTLAIVITVLRALRLPNDWAEAHWLINYEIGFIKRALPGTIFQPLFFSDNSLGAEFYISLISSFFLILFLTSLIYICFRVIKKNNFNLHSILIILLFVTSPYIVMSAHLNGYTDNILILVSILAIWLIIKKHIWTASILLAVSVFIHENILLIGLPSIVCISYVRFLRDEKLADKTIRGFLIHYFPLILLPVITLIIILINQWLFVNSEMERKIISHLSQFDFIKEDRVHLVPEELTKSYIYYLETEIPKSLRRITSLPSIVRIILPLSFFLIFIRAYIKSAGIQKYFFKYILIAIFVPLLLLFVAWDMHRIWTYPIIAAVLIIWGLSEIIPSFFIETNFSLLHIVLVSVVITFNLFLRTPLMDNEVERLSNEVRVILYSPALFLILFLTLKDYLIRKT